jgi:hypothetical protein
MTAGSECGSGAVGRLEFQAAGDKRVSAGTWDWGVAQDVGLRLDCGWIAARGVDSNTMHHF